MTQQHQNHGSMKSYLIGFVLAIILTIIPFYLVMNADTLELTRGTILTTIFVLAALQIVVQLVFFLHMDGYFAKGIDGQVFWFTLFVVFAFIVGTVWVFYEIHFNMMPY